MKIFAYGALMSLTHLKRFEIPYSSRVGAILHGYELRFEKKAVNHPQKGWANIKKNPEGHVHGILYEIPAKGVAIIDVREEYPNGYTREKVKVTLEDGKEVAAISYIARPEMIGDNLFPTEEYINLLCESKDLLPKEYIKQIKSTEVLEESLN
jgi:gamma-glutamylcyclotransferase (GGCT)/AIG2-like uncharacterized protein YtfP